MHLLPPSGLDTKRGTASKQNSSRSSMGSRGQSPMEIKMNLSKVGFFNDLEQSPLRMMMQQGKPNGESTSFKGK